jgi:formylglycine-generating enzyme required for sulfatase activity
MFYRGYDLATDGAYTDMTLPATVSTFRLDRYEVTVGRFREFVTAGMGTSSSPPAAGAGAHPNLANSGWDSSWSSSLVPDTTSLRAAIQCSATFQTWTDAPGANETRPIVCIDWFEAMAFCAWDGGYLPTEAEWHYAASGGSAQRAYPWSDPAGDLTLDCRHANWDPVPYCVATGSETVGATSPLGDGMWGQADLAGNVWEWNLDWYAAYAIPCADCADVVPATDRVFRGGGFGNGTTDMRTAFRGGDPPTYRYFDVGVRCARAP